MIKVEVNYKKYAIVIKKIIKVEIVKTIIKQGQQSILWNQECQ